MTDIIEPRMPEPHVRERTASGTHRRPVLGIALVLVLALAGIALLLVGVLDPGASGGKSAGTIVLAVLVGLYEAISL